MDAGLKPLNLHDHTLGSTGFTLPVFPADTPIAVVHSKRMGDGVTQRLGGGNSPVIIALNAPTGNDSNDNLNASLALLPLLDAFVQWA